MKPHEAFAWRRRRGNQRDNLCRPCRSAYGKEHYAANRQRYIDQAARLKKRLRAERTLWLLEYFHLHPCADCGENDPVVLEFDHLRDKQFCVGANFDSRSWQAILEEIAKCDVVCANCHKRRTSFRAGTARTTMGRS